MARFDVLIVTSEFPPYIVGGLGVYVTALVTSLVEDGLRVAVVCPRFTDTEAEEREWLTDSCCVHRIPIASEYAYSEEMSAEMRAGARALFRSRALRAPAIHVHETHFVELAEDVRREFGSKLVLTVHLSEAQLPQFAAPEPRRAAHHRRMLALERRGTRTADHIITVSRYMRSFLARELGIPRPGISAVYYPAERLLDGENVELLPARQRTLLRGKLARPDEPLVLFAGRASLQKGLPYYVRAMTSDPMRRRRARGLVIGGAPTIEWLYQFVPPAAAGNLMLVPFLSWDELAAFYQAADLGVIPSLAEPFGIAALEMVACGLPIVYADVDGLGEILGPLAEQSPCIQPVSVRRGARRSIDVDELARAIARALAASTPRSRTRYRALGRAYLAEQFTVAEFIRVHRSAYGLPSG
jgi:glycosyltransferase involved in cell wall biosynthesis